MGRTIRNIDWIALVFAVGISLFGLFVLLTIDRALFFQQALSVAVGLALAVIVSKIDITLFWFFGPLFYILSLFFILATFIYPEIRGAHRWILIGPLQMQPTEIIKPFLIISFARFITKYSPRNMRFIPMHVVLFFTVFLCVFQQPDLGTAIIYGIFWIGMMLAGGLNPKFLFLAIIFVAISAPFFWNKLAEYQKNRVISFINPAYDPQGIGYNALQAVIAVGSGEFFGRGLGRGTQSHLRFLPEYHTDFIFATIVEELGFAGGFSLIFLYFVFLWKILQVLLLGYITDSFSYTCSVGIFCMLFGQVVINIGMNMGIVPVTGITLPLVSYGGSSVLATMISFGLLWAFMANETRKT